MRAWVSLPQLSLFGNVDVLQGVVAAFVDLLWCQCCVGFECGQVGCEPLLGCHQRGQSIAESRGGVANASQPLVHAGIDGVVRCAEQRRKHHRHHGAPACFHAFVAGGDALLRNLDVLRAVSQYFLALLRRDRHGFAVDQEIAARRDDRVGHIRGVRSEHGVFRREFSRGGVQLVVGGAKAGTAGKQDQATRQACNTYELVDAHGCNPYVGSSELFMRLALRDAFRIGQSSSSLNAFRRQSLMSCWVMVAYGLNAGTSVASFCWPVIIAGRSSQIFAAALRMPDAWASTCCRICCSDCPDNAAASAAPAAVMPSDAPCLPISTPWRAISTICWRYASISWRCADVSGTGLSAIRKSPCGVISALGRALSLAETRMLPVATSVLTFSMARSIALLTRVESDDDVEALGTAGDDGDCPALQAVSTTRLDAAQSAESFRLIMVGSNWMRWIRRVGWCALMSRRSPRRPGHCLHAKRR